MGPSAASNRVPAAGGRRRRGQLWGAPGKRLGAGLRPRSAARILRAPGPWARRAAGPPPAAPRRMPAPLPAPAASLCLGSRLQPRYPRSGGPEAGGVASASSRRRAALGSAAGMLRAQGRGAPGAAASPCLRFPAARAGARAPRPRRWEGAIGKLQRRPVERPPRDRRRRCWFPAPPRGRELQRERKLRGLGAPGLVGLVVWTLSLCEAHLTRPSRLCGTLGSLSWVPLHRVLCWLWVSKDFLFIPKA